MDKKLPEPSKKDRDWQVKVTKNVQKEHVKLGHSSGKARFDKVISKILKKK